MSLIDRLLREKREDAPHRESQKAPKAEAPAPPALDNAYQDLKSRVHNELFDLIDMTRLAKASDERVRQDVAVATRRVLEESQVLLTFEERERLVSEIQDEVFGLGPLEPFLADPQVTDVLINGPGAIYV